MIATILIGLIAVLHIGIMVLEMFFWDTPRGRKAFKLTADFSRQTTVMAANQGLYNGFLAAGLIVGLILGQDGGFAFKLFFLACVAIAGLFGAATSSRKILFVQTVPATLALAALFGGI